MVSRKKDIVVRHKQLSFLICVKSYQVEKDLWMVGASHSMPPLQSVYFKFIAFHEKDFKVKSLNTVRVQLLRCVGCAVLSIMSQRKQFVWILKYGLHIDANMNTGLKVIIYYYT